ncbi:DUF5329 domain-containing protein [Pontibacter sp. E15-1]|uniref:DUF5329 family protein n=1 Tax=Pontibacter sp. E15-1 TaxID=2919918 RepID=UPI001F5033B9|nr:DUF5329 family protein [Pontibacter sp. E15-1]MCJ8165118.1 DUF5329 domain-containing protein [Pontibacter sp. E15-1]
MRLYHLVLTALLAATPGMQEATALPRIPHLTDAPRPHLTEIQKVEKLIAFVSSMEGATFIRNGSKHSCAEAAQHLQAKWQKHKADVKTAEEFIEKLASKSGMSGEDYLIQFSDGHTETAAVVLTRALREMEQQ